MAYTLNCLVLGWHDTFPVTIKKIQSVDNLKNAIKKRIERLFKGVDAFLLTLHKINVDVPDNEVANKMAEISQPGYVFDPKTRLFGPSVMSSPSCFGQPSDRAKGRIHILVELPEPTERKRKRSNEPAEVRKTGIDSQLIFRSQQLGTRHFIVDTLIENDIRSQSNNIPLFVCDILEKLQAKKSITAKQQDVLKFGIEENDIVTEHFNLVTEIDNHASETDDRATETDGRCSTKEVFHLIGLYLKEIGRTSLDQDTVRYRIGNDYFQSIATYLYGLYPDRADFRREANWPLNFVAEITTEDNKRYSYQPRSDFLFSLNRCPRINIEVCSDPIHEHDRYRLLLQAGLLVRAMNMIETQRSQFVSVAIYIGKELSASWHLVYQPDRNTPTIKYTTQDFDLKSPHGRLKFFCWLYNFPSAFPPSDNSTGVEAHLAKLKKAVDTKKYEGFTTRPPKRLKPENQAPPGGDQSEKQAPPGGDHMDHFDNPSTSQMLSKAGYQLFREVQVEGFTPLHSLPPTVCRAKGPTNKDGGVDEDLIFKFVEQDELNIHSFLLECKLSENHIIPILESFTCACGQGKLIAMKEDLALRDATPDLFETAGYSLVQQFLEGVRFIHNNLVAHLDLKPDNIVVGANNRLRIIDFGVSVRVPLLESLIKGYQGTKGWVAPEVERNPDAGYQAIRADLWSTGKVIGYLAKHQLAHLSEIKSLADQLQNSNPQQRPLLSTISLDTLSQRPKRKLDVDAQGKKEVKRLCVPLRRSMRYEKSTS